jgi:hypothetical protein
MILPDIYNNTPNNIPFSHGPNCRGSRRDKNEMIVKKNGYAKENPPPADYRMT